MSMFCYQCQEAVGNTGCTKQGVCGKDDTTSNRQDVLVYALKGIAVLAQKKRSTGVSVASEAELIMRGLFATITNANFDEDRIADLVLEASAVMERLAAEMPGAALSEPATWRARSASDVDDAFARASVLAEENEDLRSLRELVIYALKGLCAYGAHAAVLGYRDDDLDGEIVDILAATVSESDMDRLLELVKRTGDACVAAMKLLDTANTSTYGQPEMTEVNIGVSDRPGILVSGHDLKDLKTLLELTKDSGVDVYTHCEMLPAHYYPAFKEYEHFVGNYGGSWWKQEKEFASFNGAILMTTNCITPVRKEYEDRIFTTGMAGYPGVPHIDDPDDGSEKDFSPVLERARTCKAPEEIETGRIIGGFAHGQVEALADNVVSAVKAGKIRRFVVMGGCDGRQKSREYFTDLAKALPEDTVILASGCAKYRYNKLELGDIDGIPRMLDAGQCNDSYSIAVIALKLQEAFGAADINDLPIDFAVAWYEQKAVCVLLALLVLGFKGVRIGPTLPAFVSENVKNTLVEGFGLKATADVDSDLAAIVQG